MTPSTNNSITPLCSRRRRQKSTVDTSSSLLIRHIIHLSTTYSVNLVLVLTVVIVVVLATVAHAASGSERFEMMIRAMPPFSSLSQSALHSAAVDKRGSLRLLPTTMRRSIDTNDIMNSNINRRLAVTGWRDCSSTAAAFVTSVPSCFMMGRNKKMYENHHFQCNNRHNFFATDAVANQAPSSRSTNTAIYATVPKEQCPLPNQHAYRQV